MKTIERLSARVSERFPASGLAAVATELVLVAKSSAQRALWARQPFISLRVAVGLMLATVRFAVGSAIFSLRVSAQVQSLNDLVQGIEAAVNDVVFLAVGSYFLLSLEARIKRGRAGPWS